MSNAAINPRAIKVRLIFTSSKVLSSDETSRTEKSKQCARCKGSLDYTALEQACLKRKRCADYLSFEHTPRSCPLSVGQHNSGESRVEANSQPRLFVVERGALYLFEATCRANIVYSAMQFSCFD